MRYVLVVAALATFAFAEHGDPLSDKQHHKGDEHNPAYDQESFLGKDAAEDFKELTPDESKAALKTMFPKIDKNNDQFIDEDELKEHIRNMQQRYVDKDVNRTWEHYKDKLENDKLTWEKYREAVYGNADETEENTETSPEYKRMIARDRRRWKKAGGSDAEVPLDRKAYSCFMHPEDCDDMREIVVQETLEDIDKNQDGFVDLEEYIGDMYRVDDYPELGGKEPDWVQSEREMFKQHRDKDGDGKLNMAEMTDWIMPVGFDHAEAESKHLIASADGDADHRLSLTELMENYQLFTGSQATDYGEQLQKLHRGEEL